MINSLMISKTGMTAQQTQLDVISNNLANVSTNGFKRSSAVFEDLMYQNLRQVGADAAQQAELPTGLQVGLGVRTVATARQFTQGSVPPETTSITISSDGIVTAKLPGNTTPQQVGAIELANFINPAGLEPMGQNLFRESVASGNPINGAPGTTGMGSLMQGYTEASNVNVVQELVSMIQTQRAYEMNSKAIQTSDQMRQRQSPL